MRHSPIDEPPHLWLGAVGDIGDGKSPGADCLMNEVLPAIERAMLADFPERLREWRAAAAFEKAAIKRWSEDVLDAHRNGGRAPLPPVKTAGPEPQAPRLRLNDVTIEKVASLLVSAAPKGLLILRDELSGWFAGMNAYNDGGRAFWIEAYGGRPYRVERVKHPEPIVSASWLRVLPSSTFLISNGRFGYRAFVWPIRSVPPLPSRQQRRADPPIRFSAGTRKSSKKTSVVAWFNHGPDRPDGKALPDCLTSGRSRASGSCRRRWRIQRGSSAEPIRRRVI